MGTSGLPDERTAGTLDMTAPSSRHTRRIGRTTTEISIPAVRTDLLGASSRATTSGNIEGRWFTFERGAANAPCGDGPADVWK